MEEIEEASLVVKDDSEDWEMLPEMSRERTEKVYLILEVRPLIMTECEVESGLYLSQDDGKTWKPYLQIPFGNIQRVCFDPDDPQHIYLTTFGYSVIKAPMQP